ncbi:MAG: hypothetical protein K2X53_03945 [Alphaproteobacteria bacterium]|nr:hypothetical protein [Alphaproteobacteria bacterium]
MNFNVNTILSPYPINLFKRLFDWRFFICILLSLLNIYLIGLWFRKDAQVFKINREMENATVILHDQEAFRDLFKLTALDMSEKIFEPTPLSEFSQIFDSLAASSELQELSYSLEQKPILPDIFEDGRTQKNTVHFKCHAKNDTVIYKFLFDLQQNFPGFIIIENVHIAQNPHDEGMGTHPFVGDITAIILNNAPRENNVTP